MKIAVAVDHGGYGLKKQVLQWLSAAGHEALDLGTDSPESVDYPDFAVRLAQVVANGECEHGILVCGTGIGMSITANRVAGVRAALCTDPYMARMSRAHNDANVLCMGERVVGPGLARAIVEAFLEQPFEGGRHARRVEKIMALDREDRE
ncbi:MAG: ribose 5-phosphate isomerase B [Candidatus Alcyoniella australis]|nr:ribose 5-phosphate isomerase B [Candidatus Alcyoniella australis]